MLQEIRCNMTSLIPFRLQAVILSYLFIYEMLEELPEQTLVVNNIKGKMLQLSYSIIFA